MTRDPRYDVLFEPVRIGPVVATPIMRWLQGVAGRVDQFNQTMVMTAPAGVSQADVAVLLQALLDRHPMLRLRVEDDEVGLFLVVEVDGLGAVDGGKNFGSLIA